MFTGIIEKIGTIQSKTELGSVGSASISTFSIIHKPFDEPLKCGASVCVNGICLTVTESSDQHFTCNALAETLSRTNLGKEGAKVNLERALPVGGRLDGHIVTGHVDGTGSVAELRWDKFDRVITLCADTGLMDGIVNKGSVAIDGVSLTVCDRSADKFSVKIVPYTLDHTTLADLKENNTVNIEMDITGKYVRQWLQSGNQSSINEQTLMNAGFIL